MWVPLGEYPVSRSQNITPYCPIQPLYKAYMFQICFIFTPKIGEMIQFDEHIFQMGGKKTPTSYDL